MHPDQNLSQYLRTIPVKSQETTHVSTFSKKKPTILPQNAEIEEQLKRIKKQVGFEDLPSDQEVISDKNKQMMYEKLGVKYKKPPEKAPKFEQYTMDTSPEREEEAASSFNKKS